jgi:hypothetical protein
MILWLWHRIRSTARPPTPLPSHPTRIASRCVLKAILESSCSSCSLPCGLTECMRPSSMGLQYCSRAHVPSGPVPSSPVLSSPVCVSFVSCAESHRLRCKTLKPASRLTETYLELIDRTGLDCRFRPWTEENYPYLRLQ